MIRSIQRIANRLTFRQLQVFQAVYSLKNYSKAGDQLGLTQPAVSSQIRSLEQALGLPLFEYVGRRLFITAAGEKLAKSAKNIFYELNNLQTQLEELKGLVAGDLKLVAVNTAQYVVPHLLGQFLKRYPQVKVSVRVVNRAQAIQRLTENADHLVIMGIVPGEMPLSSLPFLDNELVPIVHSTHTLLDRKKVSAQEFLNSQILIRESGSGSRLALELHCQQQRLHLSPIMELGSNDALKHAVMAELGVAVVPKLSILAELQLGKLRVLNVPGFPLKRSWCVVYPSAKYPTPAMQAFINYIQKNISVIEQQFIDMI